MSEKGVYLSMYVFVTAITIALFITVSLKFMDLFHLITWNPISFLKHVTYMEWSTFEKWFVLFLILSVVAVIVYFISQTILGKSPLVFSLIAGLIIAIATEWRVLDLSFKWSSLKEISIPFVVIVLIAIRFVAETAQYNTQTVKENKAVKN